MHALVKEANERVKVVSAIGLSPVVLAKTGILEDTECTAYFRVPKIQELHGATYVDEDVVISDRIVTGRDTEAANESANAIYLTSRYLHALTRSNLNVPFAFSNVFMYSG